MAFQAVGSIDEFPAGQAVEIALGARRIAVYHVEGQLYALKNICPHEAVRLHKAPPRDCVAVCRGHGWEFDLKTGQCLRGEKDKRVATYPVKVKDGEVFIDVG